MQDDSVLLDDDFHLLLGEGMGEYLTHAYCTAGRCELTFDGRRVAFAAGDCVIVIASRQVTEVRPSEDFRVKVIYIKLPFLQAATPHSSYGVRGGMSLYLNPVMHLNERERRLCERDFDEVERRMRDPHAYFHREEMMAALQVLFVDFFEFHSRIYHEDDSTTQVRSLVERFVVLLEAGEYRKHREVGWYASELCITPKYLSEACKKVSGHPANFWINYFAANELLHLLKDKALSFTEIAELFDFSSASQFVRYVQNNLGKAPSAFR